VAGPLVKYVNKRDRADHTIVELKGELKEAITYRDYITNVRNEITF
jgi:hypothetical protein